VVIEGESYILALPRGNITFHLTSIKLFYIGDIKVSSKGPKDNPEYYSEGEGNAGIIPPIIPLILLKYNRGRPYKNPNIIVFL
jgi:hypothetical protein